MQKRILFLLAVVGVTLLSANTAWAVAVADHGGPYTGLINVAVNFDGSGSTGGGALTYSWDFDGDLVEDDTGVNPTFTYTATGTYDVTLIVTDASDTSTDTVSTTAVISQTTSEDGVAPQVIGMRDSAFAGVAQADCRVCHSSGVPDRHHMLYGTVIPSPSVVPYPDSDGVGGDDTNYNCLNCHGDPITVVRDCTTCHVATPHHATAAALARDCKSCHGSVVDKFDDGHYIPTYSPSLVTPYRSGGTAYEQNANGVAAGACNYCHGADGGASPPILSNMGNHHGTGLNVLGQCFWCHDDLIPDTGPSGPDDGLQMRVCEECHGPGSLHNIQSDSNGGGVVVGQELLGYGHVGRDQGPTDSDCWGCHGFGGAAAPDTGAIIPTVYGSDLTSISAGTDTTITLIGSALTNVTNGTLYESSVTLTAADGSSITLTPDSIDELALTVTIPGTTAAGIYDVQAVKDDVASGPTVITITPDAVITSATCEDGVVTITGSGLEGHETDSVSSVTGTVTSGKGKKKTTTTTVTGTITSWTDTEIVVEFDSCPSSVSVTSVYSVTATAEIGKADKPGKGKGRNK